MIANYKTEITLERYAQSAQSGWLNRVTADD
jgi:hypothetical protein